MESVGGYRINRRQRPGPTSEIYEATGAGGQGRLVIRFLEQAPPLTPTVKHACRAELLEVAKLRHPHIGQALNVDAAPDGVPFVVREHVDGQSLKTLLAGDRCLGPTPVVQIVAQVARTLAAAHRVRVLHRALRPSQVFVYDAGGVLRLGRVLGFGLWRLRPDPPACWLPYLAPEQRDGRTGIDGRADQFSLAAIAHRMLSGAAPTVDRDPAPLTAAGVNPELDAALRRALAGRPAARFPSMLAFAAALEAAHWGWPRLPGRPAP
jgi:serine/threonine protein kinase